jgi:hypothetical protein
MSFFKAIKRRELPALERRGCVAQIISGDKIVVVTFHPTVVDWETETEVTVSVPASLRAVETGYSDTVLLGCLSGEGIPSLLDILMLQKKGQRQRSWRARVAIMEGMVSTIGARFNPGLRMAEIKRSGLIKVFDEVVDSGGMGLLLRCSGKSVPLLCKMEG